MGRIKLYTNEGVNWGYLVTPNIVECYDVDSFDQVLGVKGRVMLDGYYDFHSNCVVIKLKGD